MDIFVTGIGIVSAIGNDCESNFESLKEGITGISWSPKYELLMGQVSLSNKDIQEKLKSFGDNISRTTLLSQLAAKEAWGKNIQFKEIRTGLVSSTSVGGLDKIESNYLDTNQNSQNTKNSLMIHENGLITEQVAKHLGISGFIDTISTACSSGANAIMHGARLIKAGLLDRVVVGGADSIALFDSKGFSSLNIYDNELCKPFSDNRNGLNLGEGAAFLVLENELSLDKSQNKPLCKLSGWNNSSDAFHQTASSENGYGAFLAMQKTLEKGQLIPSDISYINMHGTGTRNNDLAETAAITTLFKDQIPPFSSTKPYTGHTLAAAGAIEAVFSIMSIQHQCIFPNLHFQSPMVETSLIPNLNFVSPFHIEHVLSNSFGFGGNCSSLVFSKI